MENLCISLSMLRSDALAEKKHPPEYPAGSTGRSLAKKYLTFRCHH